MAMKFVIRGEPVPKGRPKITSFGGHAHAYTPAKTRQAENNLRAQIVQQLPDGFMVLDGPLRLSATFTRTKPKSKKKSDIYPITKPDLDNFVKTLLDSMNTVVFKDDSQICEIRTSKKYGEPGIDILIEGME